MKKLFITFTFLFTTNVHFQEIPFEIIGGEIEWQKVYEEDLNIEPQTIFFKKPIIK